MLLSTRKPLRRGVLHVVSSLGRPQFSLVCSTFRTPLQLRLRGLKTRRYATHRHGASLHRGADERLVARCDGAGAQASEIVRARLNVQVPTVQYLLPFVQHEKKQNPVISVYCSIIHDDGPSVREECGCIARPRAGVTVPRIIRFIVCFLRTRENCTTTAKCVYVCVSCHPIYSGRRSTTTRLSICVGASAMVGHTKEGVHCSTRLFCSNCACHAMRFVRV